MKINDRYFSVPEQSTLPSDSEIATLLKVQWDSQFHESGGSYNMIARWVKASHVVIGRNNLYRPANTIDVAYPDICGVHAELDLFNKKKSLRGGIVYIAGRRYNGSEMPNTMPCRYCSAILGASGVRHIVFFSEGIPMKVSTNDLRLS